MGISHCTAVCFQPQAGQSPGEDNPTSILLFPPSECALINGIRIELHNTYSFNRWITNCKSMCSQIGLYLLQRKEWIHQKVCRSCDDCLGFHFPFLPSLPVIAPFLDTMVIMKKPGKRQKVVDIE